MTGRAAAETKTPMLLASLLPLTLTFSSADALPSPEAMEAALEDRDAAEAGDPSGALLEDSEDPQLQALLAGLDEEARAIFLGLDEAGIGALFDRQGRGEALSAQEQQIVEALTKVALEAFDAELSYSTGDVALRDGLATLHLGEDFRYLGPADAERVLTEAWGNPPGTRTLGMIIPAKISPLDPDEGWGVLITYSEEGHVSDDDADDIDYDELLEQLQEATEEANTERVAGGYEPMHLVGWAESPRYASEMHALYWAQELSVDGASEHSLNYAIRVLGRKGVLEFNAVSAIDQLATVKPEMEKIFARVEFDEGNRYIDFDPDLDDVAAYGLGGLIAGKVALKAGLWAGLVKLLIAGKKLLIFLVIGAVAGVKGLLGMRKKDEESEE